MRDTEGGDRNSKSPCKTRCMGFYTEGGIQTPKTTPYKLHSETPLTDMLYLFKLLPLHL